MSEPEAVFITSIWQGDAPKRTDETANCVTPECGAKLSQYNVDTRPFCFSCYSTFNTEMITQITYYQELGYPWRKAIRQAENKLRPTWFPKGGPWSRL